MMGSDNSKQITTTFAGSSTHVNSYSSYSGNNKRMKKFPCFDDTEIEEATMRSKASGTPMWYFKPSERSCCTIVRIKQPFSLENCEPRVTYWLSEIKPDEDEETHSPPSIVLNDGASHEKVLPKNNIKTQHISGSECMSSERALKIQIPKTEYGFEALETCAMSCNLGSRSNSISPIIPPSLRRNSRSLDMWTECSGKSKKTKELNSSSRNAEKQALDSESYSLRETLISNTHDLFLQFRKPRSRFRGKRSPMNNWNVEGWSHKDEIKGVNTVAYDSPVFDDLQNYPTPVSIGRGRRRSQKVELDLGSNHSCTSVISELSKSSLEYSTPWESESSSDYCDTSLST